MSFPLNLYIQQFCMYLNVCQVNNEKYYKPLIHVHIVLLLQLVNVVCCSKSNLQIFHLFLMLMILMIVKSCNNSLLFVKSCDICLCSGSKKVVDTPIVWNFVRMINILILFRLLRIIPNIKVRNSAEAKLLDGLILCLNRPG